MANLVRFIPYTLGVCFFLFVFMTTGSWLWGAVIGAVVLALGLYPEHRRSRSKRKAKPVPRKSGLVSDLAASLPFPFRISRPS